MPAPTATDDTLPLPPYLRGDAFALRAFERADAEHAMQWWPEPFPADAAEATHWLEETAKVPWWLGHSTDLALVRTTGGPPIGAVNISRWRDLHGAVTLSVGPLLPPDERTAAATEAARLTTRWLIEELGYLAAAFIVPADLAIADPAASGLRRVGVWREARLSPQPGRPHARQDEIIWEAINPDWVHAFAPAVEPLPPRLAGRIDLTPGARPDALKNPVAIGPRLYLRPIDATDSAIAHWRNVEPETGFDLGRRPFSPIAKEVGAAERYRKRPPEEIVLGVARLDGGELIGAVGVDSINWVHRTGETFSFFRHDTRGQGLGTEAKTLLLAYCFERLGLHALHSTIFSINPRSAAAVLKQGYRYAGVIRAPIIRRGRFHQDWLFDILAADWLALQRGESPAEPATE